MSSCKPHEEIALLYSSSNASNHSPNCENVQAVAQENFKERSGDTFANDCTTKGCNTIFYRTVQYLHMVLRQNRGYNQKESNKFSTEEVERQEHKGNRGFSSPTHSNDREMGTLTSERNKHSCTLGINSATLSFKEGEFIAITGKHGAGKTTLLRLLSGRLMCGCKQVRLL